MKKIAAILAVAALAFAALAPTLYWRDGDANVTGYEIWHTTNLAAGFTFLMQTNIPGGNFTNCVTVPVCYVAEFFMVRAMDTNDGIFSDWATR